MLFNFIQ